MANSKSILTKDLTRYGDRSNRLSELLFYGSDRTIDNYKKMRMYPACWLALNFIKMGLADVPFTVECEDFDTKAIIEAAFRPIWHQMVNDSFEALDFGWKCMELRYEPKTIKYKDEDRNDQTFDAITFKQPRSLDGDSIDLLVNTPKGTLKGFIQDSSKEREVLVEDRKALVFTHNMLSGDFYGISIFEPVFTDWYDVQINRQFHMRWLEKKGTGIFQGRYPVGTSDIDGTNTDNQDVMINMLNNILEGTVIALPSDVDENGTYLWKVEPMNFEDKTDAFLAKRKDNDMKILHGMLVPDKAVTQGEMGARASVESFQDIFVTTKQAVLNNSVNTISKHMLPHFMELNFGPDVHAEIKPGKLDDKSKDIANDIARSLIDKGSLKPEKQWLIDKTGIPFEEEEEIIEDLPIEEQTPEEVEIKDNTIIGTFPKRVDVPQGKMDVVKDVKKLSQMTPRERKHQGIISNIQKLAERALTQREEKFNLEEFSDFLDKEADICTININIEMKTQTDRIKRYIEKNYRVIKDINIIKGIKINVNPFKRKFKEFVGSVYGQSLEKIDTGYNAKIELASNDYTPNEFVGLRSNLTGSKFADDLEKAIQYAVSAQMTADMGTAVINSSIDKIIDDYNANKIPKTTETEIGFSIGQATTDYYKINQALIKAKKIKPEQEIMRYQYSAVMDKHTCPLCQKMNGTITRANSAIMKQYNTPQHYNCRCVWLPISQLEIISPRHLDTDLTKNKQGKPLTINEFNAIIKDKISFRTF